MLNVKELSDYIGNKAAQEKPYFEPRFRYGQVSAITAPTLSITIGGNADVITAVPKLASYTTATVDDLILILEMGPDLLVLGEVG